MDIAEKSDNTEQPPIQEQTKVDSSGKPDLTQTQRRNLRKRIREKAIESGQKGETERYLLLHKKANNEEQRFKDKAAKAKTVVNRFVAANSKEKKTELYLSYLDRHAKAVRTKDCYEKKRKQALGLNN